MKFLHYKENTGSHFTLCMFSFIIISQYNFSAYFHFLFLFFTFILQYGPVPSSCPGIHVAMEEVSTVTEGNGSHDDTYHGKLYNKNIS